MPTINLLHFGLRRLMGALADKELRVASRSNYYVQLSGLALLGAPLILDIVLGLLLWRHARRNVREYVF